MTGPGFTLGLLAPQSASSLLRHSINIFDKLSDYSWLSAVLGGVAASERERKSPPLFVYSLQSGTKDTKQMPVKLFTTFSKQCTCKSEIINLAHKDSGGKN